MDSILDRARRFKLADTDAIIDADNKISQFRICQKMFDKNIPFLACNAMDISTLANFINCYNTGSGVFATKTVADNIVTYVHGENALFFDVPKIGENDEENADILYSINSNDCTVFINSINTPEISPREQYTLKSLAKLIKKNPDITKKLIFILQSDYTASQPTDEDIQKRRNSIATLIDTDDMPFFTLFAIKGITGKKQGSKWAIEKSGIIKIRDYIKSLTPDILSAHLMIMQEKRKAAKTAVNTLFSQISQKLNIIYNVLSLGEDITEHIQKIVSDTKEKIQELLWKNLEDLENIPQSESIKIDFMPEITDGFKSEKQAYTSIKNELTPIYNNLENITYPFITDAANSFRAALNYANPEYHCFARISHVCANIMSDCLDELQKYHISLLKTKYASCIQFKDEKNFIDTVKFFERDLRDYITPSSKHIPLDHYLKKLKISKNEDGHSMFGIKKYIFSIDNADEIIAAIEDDMNKNLDENKKFVWNSIIFIQQKFLNSFRSEISSRISSLESNALNTYAHPQIFKDLEHELNITSEVLTEIQSILATL